MLDIETLGVRHSSVILSIGAVEFDLKTGEIGEIFYRCIGLQSSLDAGLTIDADTLKWWLLQNPKTLSENLRTADPGDNLKPVLSHFIRWWNHCQSLNAEPLEIWGNSNIFDCVKLENAFLSCGLQRPWKDKKERDYRTIVQMFPDIPFVSPDGEKHNPVKDCKFQIARLCAVWKYLNYNAISKFQDTQFQEDYENTIVLLDEIRTDRSTVLHIRDKVGRFLDGLKPITNADTENKNKD